MDIRELCDTIKNNIEAEYGSVAKFSRIFDIPYSTLNNVLKNGLDNSKFSMVVFICQKLDIDIFNNANLPIASEHLPIVSMISKLDERALDVVSGVVESEYERCMKF